MVYFSRFCVVLGRLIDRGKQNYISSWENEMNAVFFAIAPQAKSVDMAFQNIC